MAQPSAEEEDFNPHRHQKEIAYEDFHTCYAENIFCIISMQL